ncbi:hypothetical protein X731_24535 [Mesorhizobium sp. L2C054A000]|nr:hypothetical protein [Mesorhizobium sp. L2C054A000]ESZ41006.1 hypothetical protein X731_24535 [Mesorhizobium sp. L2C054A000]
MYTGVCLFGIFGLMRSSVVSGLYAVGLLLFCIHMGAPSNGQTVIAPLVILFAGGAMLQMSKEIDIARIGPFALAVLFLLYAPGVSERVLALMRQWPFGFAWDIDAGGIRYLAYLVALPVAVIYLCAFAPFSLRMRNDYSYGVFVFACPIQQICVHYFQAWSLPAEPLLLFAIAAPASILVAIPLWHYVEHPIGKWRFRQPSIPAETSFPVD